MYTELIRQRFNVCTEQELKHQPFSVCLSSYFMMLYQSLILCTVMAGGGGVVSSYGLGW
jgi:hypothetical protein